MGLFSKKDKDESIEVKRSWYEDRYQTVVVQRNFLALVTVASLAGIIFSVLSVVKIVSSKTIEPFVIGIEDKTGITNVIRPIQQEKYAYDEVLRRYFLTQYLSKRETYNITSFEYNYFTVIRLFSNSTVYGAFRSSVYVNNPNSPVRLGTKQRTIKIKSIVFMPPVPGQAGFPVQIRFKSEDGDGVNPGGDVKHKLVTMSFDFQDLVLTDEERAINPLGFQVIAYRVDDEIVQ